MLAKQPPRSADCGLRSAEVGYHCKKSPEKKSQDSFLLRLHISSALSLIVCPSFQIRASVTQKENAH